MRWFNSGVLAGAPWLAAEICQRGARAPRDGVTWVGMDGVEARWGRGTMAGAGVKHCVDGATALAAGCASDE